MLCKDEEGHIVSWSPASKTTFRPYTQASYRDRESPLHRIGELFNVNHFIVSQARPYLAPFLRSDLHHPNPKQDGRWRLSMPILRLVVLEIQHRLHQLDELGMLSPSIRRFLLDESIPGPSLTLVPELTPGDFFKLLENPTKEGLDYWILKGERSVWPAVTAIKIRCAIEVELDRGYQLVRRRKPFDPETISLEIGGGGGGLRKSGEVQSSHGFDNVDRSVGKRSRPVRAASFGGAVS
jgi:TAG lipase/lysophosphatidylethanolamine acyltransferase